jgi:glycosyltransferase involved in cell wall biosynthesis
MNLMSKETNQALFVTHNYGFYGASKSLQLLLKNNPGLDITLVIQMKERLTPSTRNRIARFYGINAGSIKQFFLPWNNCFEGRKTDRFNRMMHLLKNLLWKMNKKQFYSFLKKNKFSYIHLNSIVLCDMIRDQYPFIIHIREYLVEPSKQFFLRLQQAKGIIYIDESVQEPFQGSTSTSPITLSNPVDMTGVSDHLDEAERFGGTTVISLIGRLEEGKGVDFIIKTFRQTQPSDLKLLIVGDEGDGISSGYRDLCKRIADDDERIIFWGQEQNINRIYAFSDYIIRGETDFRMGRSVLEALYANCEVIIPSRNLKVINRNRELNLFRERVHTYIPRDTNSLKELFLLLDKRKIHKNSGNSNVESYVSTFNDYVKGIL